MRDYVAEFKARGGQVTRVEEGHGLGMTGRDWYKATRGELTDNALIEQRRVASVDHAGRAHIVNGLGETITFE